MAKKKLPVKKKPAKKPADGKLFPEAKVPKGIASLARRMKEAELERKRQGVVESEAREQLCAKMVQAGCHRFQIDVDGQDYEFKLEELAKVTSKQLKQDED